MVDATGMLAPYYAGLGNEASMNQANQKGQTERANIAADASKYPATLKQQRFGWATDNLFPFLKDAYGNLSGKFGQGAGAGSPGGQTGINTNPIWSNDMTNQKINSERAISDQRASGQVRQFGQQMAGRGFGSNSPAFMMGANNIWSQNNAAGSQQALNTRLDANKANATFTQAGQTAAANNVTERGKTLASQYNALIGALGSPFAGAFS